MQLLARAKALLVRSQTHGGPFEAWVEPGATVVSGAAASGTPVIASDNGCLPEIVPGIGAVLPETGPVSSDETHTLLDTLPRPHAVRQLATRRWDYLTIAAKYLTVYQRAIDGDSWT
jgi:glycosyltransferase involved in cell wall biosynthesis